MTSIKCVKKLDGKEMQDKGCKGHNQKLHLFIRLVWAPTDNECHDHVENDGLTLFWEHKSSRKCTHVFFEVEHSVFSEGGGTTKPRSR